MSNNVRQENEMQRRVTVALDRLMRGFWRLAVLLVLASMFEPNSYVQQEWLTLLTVIVLFAGVTALRDILMGIREAAEIGWVDNMEVET